MKTKCVGVVLGVVMGVYAAAAAAEPAAAPAAEERRLEELRNTVVNLLQALVAKGVMTQEQAQELVKQAQDKAGQDANTKAVADAAREKEEASAVRVTHVPQIVKDQISAQVAQDVKPQVVKDVLAAAREEKWGVPGALPDWIRNVKLTGDVRLRGQGDAFGEDNIENSYPDYLTINDKGGRIKAAQSAWLNTTEDRQRLRLRARLGAEAQLNDGLKIGIRASTGNLRDPVSTNQTLGNTGGRYQLGVDQAYARWDFKAQRSYPWLTLQGGRIASPWMSTDLVWDSDLSFEGVAATLRQGISSVDPAGRHLFLTVGAFPLQEVELSSKDKWLYGAQLGLDWSSRAGTRLRLAGAIYDYRNISGRLNALDSPLFDYTAPQFLQKGNTLFDIRNDADPSTNLYALAADYTDLDVFAALEVPVMGNTRIGLTADFVRNIGFDQAKMLARAGGIAPERTDGYQGELSVNHGLANKRGYWRGFIGYRYLEADAVLDAFTDSDFHGGGTDAKGYFFGGDVWVSDNAWLRLRYLSGSEIDLAPLAIDVLQLDFNAQF